jgi:hypothetical protein
MQAARSINVMLPNSKQD